MDEDTGSGAPNPGSFTFDTALQDIIHDTCPAGCDDIRHCVNRAFTVGDNSYESSMLELARWMGIDFFRDRDLALKAALNERDEARREAE